REKIALPRGIAQHRAKLEVTNVVGAEQVAVRQQHALAVELDRLVVPEQAAAGRERETAADQEIVIAVHDGALDARFRERGEPVVADERLETLDRFGPAGVEMQVRYEERRHRATTRRRARCAR